MISGLAKLALLAQLVGTRFVQIIYFGAISASASSFEQGQTRILDVFSVADLLPSQLESELKLVGFLQE
jgi:hypothetical protein